MCGAYIAGEPTLCLAPGHGATAFRQDWDIQDGMAVDELPLSERIKFSISFIIFLLKYSTAYGEAQAECRKPGKLSKAACGDTVDGNF